MKTLSLAERIKAVREGKIVKGYSYHRANPIHRGFETSDRLDGDDWKPTAAFNAFFDDGAKHFYLHEEPKEPSAEEKFKQKLKSYFITTREHEETPAEVRASQWADLLLSTFELKKERD